jgi:peptide/nickel transport system permease protein
MRSVLRRLLWLGPTLVLITLITFGVLSIALPADPEVAAAPLFFNPDPGAVEHLALNALREVADAGAGSADAQRELARLGGAALPYVLPALDSLSPDGRARVVKALQPVGTRMGFDMGEQGDQARQVLFWTRFWEEHSIDYRPSVARRAVARVTQRSTSLREAEVRQLDTYALDELVSHMLPVRAEADVDRVRRLTQLAADMTGEEQLRLTTGDVSEAQRVAARWVDWWSQHRTQYKTYSGTERVTAMLRDTRYGGWVAQAARQRLGLLRGGRPAWDVMSEGAMFTLPLLACGVIGTWGNIALWALVTALARRRGVRLLWAFGVLRAAFPAVLLAVLLSPFLAAAAGRTAMGGLIMLLGGAPLSLLCGAGTAETQSGDFIRTLRSLGASRWQLALASLRLSSASMLVQLGAQLSGLLSLTFVVEYALGLPGLGTRTIEALRQPDLNWLMAITICTALFVGLLQAAGEVLISVLDPRWQDATQRLEGAAT